MQQTVKAKKTIVTQFELSNLIRKSKLFSKVKLKSSSRLVLESLVYHFPKIRVSISTLEEETGCGRTSVLSGISELKEEGLIVVVNTGRSSIYKLTSKFYDLLKIEHQQEQNKYIRGSEIELPHNKQERKQNKKQNNFSFKKYSDLFKNNFQKYCETINNLSESDREKLCKLKLGRTNLTNFQKQNIDKIIMLSDYEINRINTFEPYYRQENIDIYYNRRIAQIKINTKTEQNNKITQNNPRQEFIEMLKCGYKAFKSDKAKLNKFLARNREQMQEYNILESDLM